GAIRGAGGWVRTAGARCQVAEERPQVVGAAAHAEAVRSAVLRVAAAGAVVGDLRSADDCGACRDVDAAAEAVAAVAPVVAVATDGLVVADGGIENGRGDAGGIEAAAQAVAAAGASFVCPTPS